MDAQPDGDPDELLAPISARSVGPDRPDLRFRPTLRRLMSILAFVGICLAAFRLHPSLGCFAFGVFSLTLLRTFTTIDRSQAVGLRMRPWGVVRTFFGSMLVGATILCASLLPGLASLPYYAIATGHPNDRIAHVEGIYISAALAIGIAYTLRRRLW